MAVLIPTSDKYQTVTIDLAGTGGTLANNATVALTVRDENFQGIRTIYAVANGVGSSGVAIVLITPKTIFPEYDGLKDDLGVVMTTTGAITWSTNGTGPRILRYKSNYLQQNDIQCFSLADGSDRILGANITGAAAATYVSSGASFDARAVGGVFTPGAVIAGWTDTAPTQAKQLSPAAVQSRRATAFSATQTDGGLLALDTNDVLAFGLGSIVGALTGSISQGAGGITYGLGSTSMTVRYLYLHLLKGEE
jgi:hypothetical protein